MATLTEQDFKDLEFIAKRGINNILTMKELSKGEFESLENMLEKLNCCRNELLGRFSSVEKYFSLTSTGLVHSGNAKASTAHRLVYNLACVLWDNVDFVLNPDDHKWEIDNPNKLRLENLPECRNEVIEKLNIHLANAEIDLGKAGELKILLRVERQKAWKEYQQEFTLHKKGSVSAGDAFMEKNSNDEKTMQALERVKQKLKSQSFRESLPSEQKTEEFHRELVQKLTALGFTIPDGGFLELVDHLLKVIGDDDLKESLLSGNMDNVEKVIMAYSDRIRVKYIAQQPTPVAVVAGGISTEEKKEAKPKRLSKDERNTLALAYLEQHATKDRKVSIRELSDHIRSKDPTGKCPQSSACKLPAWIKYQEMWKEENPPKLKAVQYLDNEVGKHDPELQKLIGESKADDELDKKGKSPIIHKYA